MKKLFILYFSISLMVIVLVFGRFKSKTNKDSLSYQYFTHPESEIAFFHRPPAYPLFLWIIEPIDQLVSSIDVLVVSQILFISLAIAIGGITGYKMSRSTILASMVVIMSVFNLSLNIFTNIIAPESLLFLLTQIHIAILAANFRKIDQTILLIFSALLLTMTKPIFSYWIVPMGLFMFVFQKEKVKAPNLLIASIIAIYLLPVLSINLHNYQQTGLFRFSSIKEINLVGKILQYDLVKQGPSQLHLQETKLALQSQIDKGDLNPWNAMSLLPCSRSHCPNLFEFTNKTILTNFPQYLVKSAVYFYTILTEIPRLEYLEYYDHVIENEKVEYFKTIWYGHAHQYIFSQYYRVAILMLAAISMVEFFLIIKNQNIKKNDQVYIFCFLLVCYYLAVLSLGSYTAYRRLRAPLDSTLWFLLLWSGQRMYHRVYKALKAK